MRRDYSELPKGLELNEYVKLGAKVIKDKEKHRFAYLCACFAAKQYCPTAFLLKASCCISGRGTKRSEERAIKYFLKAIELLDVLDVEALGLFYDSIKSKEDFLYKLLKLQKVATGEKAEKLSKFTSKCLHAPLGTGSEDESERSVDEIADILNCAKAIRSLERDKSFLTLSL